MAISFPASPTVGDVYTYSGRSWQWNGYGWQVYPSSFVTGAITVNTTTISGGTSGRVAFDNAGTFGEASGVTTNGSSQLTLGVASTTQGALVLNNTTAFTTTIQSSNSSTASWTFTLPTTAGTNGYVLSTDGSGATSWIAAGGGGSGTVNSGTAGQMTYYASTGTAVSGNANATISSGSLTLGQSGSVTGEVKLSGSGSGIVTVAPATTAGTWTLTLPTTGGTNGYVLSTDGSGTTSWIALPAAGITVNTTTITGGTSGRMLYDNAGTVGEASGVTTNGTATLTVGVQGTTQGSLVLGNTNSTFSTTVQSSNSSTVAWTLTLPTSAGSSGQALITDGSGNASWGAAGATITDDTTTNATEYPVFANATSGSLTTAYVSNTNLTFNPLTGQLTALNVASSAGIVLNANTITANYTLPSGYNGMSAGPVVVNSGVTVTVPSGSAWAVV